MAITRTSWVDDDGSGTTGTVINNAVKTELYNQIDAALLSEGGPPATSTITTTGTIATLPIPAGSGNLNIFMANGAAATVNGIAAGMHGQQLTVTALLDFSVSFMHQAGSVGQRLLNFATSGPTPIISRGAAVFVYDGPNGYWRMVAHEQGGWIRQPFNAAHFFADAATWTVGAADVQEHLYRLTGKSIVWKLSVAAPLSPGTANVHITLPGGYACGLISSYVFELGWFNDGSTSKVAEIYTYPAQTAINLRPVGGGPLAAGTLTLGVALTMPIV